MVNEFKVGDWIYIKGKNKQLSRLFGRIIKINTKEKNIWKELGTKKSIEFNQLPNYLINVLMPNYLIDVLNKEVPSFYQYHEIWFRKNELKHLTNKEHTTLLSMLIKTTLKRLYSKVYKNGEIT